MINFNQKYWNKVAVVDSYMQILTSFYYQKEYYNMVTFILGYYRYWQFSNKNAFRGFIYSLFPKF